MAFGLGRLEGLQTKLDIYEDLSKEMLDKLERAVSTISENSNKVSVILERHENRLDEATRSDQLIIKMIEEMKDQEEKNHNILHERIDRIQKKVDTNQRFVIGAGAVLATLGVIAQIAFPIYRSLTNEPTASMIRTEVVRTIG
jgi:hypothetical protein|tara:strand:- start:513 stop:941 length:429 start_codon:yes stop_codon:yes gene_type:complete